MLRSIKAHNFKTFLNSEFTFSPQQLIIGRNNSGKTNFAHLLQFVRDTATLPLDGAARVLPGGLDGICNWHLKTNLVEIELTCVLIIDGIDHEYTYQLKLDCSPGSALKLEQLPAINIVQERLTVYVGDSKELILLESDGKTVAMPSEDFETLPGTGVSANSAIPAPHNATTLSKVYELRSNRKTILFREYLGTWRYFSLSPAYMRAGRVWSNTPQSNPTDVPWTACDPFGADLPDAIYNLKNIDEKRYRRLLNHVAFIEPALEAINHYNPPGRSPVPFVALKGQPRASWYGLSDGTLRALGLALIIETAAACSPPVCPGACLSIIEEPENGIAPGVLRRFFNLFEEWAPILQFIFTTHSPYVIDFFDHKRECVTIFRKGSDRTLTSQPPKALPAMNGDDHFSLSAAYASELCQ